MPFAFLIFSMRHCFLGVLTSCLLVLISSCQHSSYEPLVKRSFSDNTWILQTQGNATNSTHNEDPIHLELNLRYYQKEKQASHELLLSHFSPRGQLLVSKGDQLTLSLDKHSTLSLFCQKVHPRLQKTLNTQGVLNPTHPRQVPFLKSSRLFTKKDFNKGSYCTAVFPLEASEMQAILKSKSLRFSIEEPIAGKRILGNFDKKNFKILAMFDLELKRESTQ